MTINYQDAAARLVNRGYRAVVDPVPVAKVSHADEIAAYLQRVGPATAVAIARGIAVPVSVVYLVLHRDRRFRAVRDASSLLWATGGVT